MILSRAFFRQIAAVQLSSASSLPPQAPTLFPVGITSLRVEPKQRVPGAPYSPSNGMLLRSKLRASEALLSVCNMLKLSHAS